MRKKSSVTARTMKEFVKRRAKETQQADPTKKMYISPSESGTPSFSADSHKLKAIQRHEGFVGKKMSKKFEKDAQKRKKTIRAGMFGLNKKAS